MLPTHDDLDAIVQDVLLHSRAFLPGRPCDVQALRANLNGSVLYDGLTREEAALILSVLPQDASRMYISAMDKGLSGAKVLQGRYPDKKGRLSKPFVLKLGPRNKILREAEAMQQLVAPFIPGAVPPIYRQGPNGCLLVQELAGLSTTSRVVSLRTYARTHHDAAAVVGRLFDERLHHWYQTGSAGAGTSYGQAFEWYLEKAPAGSDLLPSGWGDLVEWVKSISGLRWTPPDELVEHISREVIAGPETVVHGDLHSQNVVVDDRTGECWPIDFGWCHDAGSPLVDYVMLEVSLKFLALPMRADLRTLIEVEGQLSEEPTPTVRVGQVPYGGEIQNVLEAVLAVREQALLASSYSYEEYRRGLFLMTYAHAAHRGLNRPLVLASLQMLTGRLSQ